MRIMLAAVAAILLAPAAAPAQMPPEALMPPDVEVVQKSWRAETRNPALDDDPFAPNVEFHDAQRAQKMSDLQNAIRARGSESREPPAPRAGKIDDPAQAKDVPKNARPKPMPSERRVTYTYRAKVRNTGKKTVKLVRWGYAFLDPETGQPLGVHRYSTKVRIRPGEDAELAGRSGAPQTATVSARTAGKKLVELLIIYRVEYEGGEVWQSALR